MSLLLIPLSSDDLVSLGGELFFDGWMQSVIANTETYDSSPSCT